jgi:hypothetical protein
MTEYAVIIAAIEVAAFGAYLTLGNSVSSIAKGTDSMLTDA